MSHDERHVDSYSEIASQLALPMISEDYGVPAVVEFLKLVRGIRKIYKCLQYQRFSQVLICTPLSSDVSLEVAYSGFSGVIVYNFESLVQLNGSTIFIEVRRDGSIIYFLDVDFDLFTLKNNVIIYEYSQSNLRERIYGKSEFKELPSIADTSSYFAVETYKELNLALEDYGTKMARHSFCPYLESAWADDNRIFFRPGPEGLLRDSLTLFLKARLRDSEVRPEQVMDTSHPVDIKVTWASALHLAIIEIKWLGKSISEDRTSFTQIYAQSRALSGAEQLAGYLDSNVVQAPTRSTMGYLVVFDARRARANLNTTQLTREHGLEFVNTEINYNPVYHSIRRDFANRYRFFMEPRNLT